MSIKPATAQTGDQMASVDEIIVSARKRDENLQDVPTAVTAITQEAIADLNILSIDDVARHTPGFSFSQAWGRTTERPVVRGAGNILAGVQYGVESGTAYFINGQYYSGDLATIDMHQVERVEVIKGPQSALYGRNSYAGAVNFIMREPSDERMGRVTAEMSQHGQYQLYANLAGPLGERVDGSISVRHYEYGGELTNSRNNQVLGDEESFSIAGMLRFELSDAATLTTRLSYIEDDDGPRAFALLKSNENNCYPGYRSNRFRLGRNNNPVGADDNGYQYFCGEIPPADQASQDLDHTPWVGVAREMIYANAVLDIDVMNGHTLSTKLGYLDNERRTGADSDHQLGGYYPFGPPGVGNAFFNSTTIDEYTDYSVEISITSPQDRRVRYIAGVFYYDWERDETGQYLTTPDRLNSTNEITNQAAFASIEFDITDKLTASVEARYADDEKTLTERDSGLNTPTSPLVYHDPVSASYDSFTPRVVVNYRANEDIMFYGSFAQGTKPGGVNGASGASAGSPSYEEEEADALELGAKTSWLDGRIIANLSLYRNEISQYQLTTPVGGETGSASAVTSIATNQGDVEIDGVELELRTFPADNVTFGMTYAWTDATFTRGCDEFQFVLTSGGFLMAPFDINDRSTWNRYRIVNDSDGNPYNPGGV
ncbi:MAG: TonB-dependent receptor, partial [Alphaproteobacteria bacterium]|nr:TonB-dependent receptor [Alphaproteobacteria bacterium]